MTNVLVQNSKYCRTWLARSWNLTICRVRSGVAQKLEPWSRASLISAFDLASTRWSSAGAFKKEPIRRKYNNQGWKASKQYRGIFKAWEAYPPYPGWRQSSIQAYNFLGKQPVQLRRPQPLSKWRLPESVVEQVFPFRIISEIVPLLQAFASSLLEVVVAVRSNHVLKPRLKNLQRYHQQKFSSSKRRQARHPKNEGSQYSCQKPTRKKIPMSIIQQHRFPLILKISTWSLQKIGS